MDKSYIETIEGLKKLKIKLPDSTDFVVSGSVDLENWTEGRLLKIEEGNIFSLNPKIGMQISKNENVSILAYDESIISYSTLEGKVICTAHSLVYVRPDNYIPITYVTLRFYTRSKIIEELFGRKVIVSDNIERQINIDKILDEMQFIIENCIDNSIILIDGPLIAGDAYTTFISILDDFDEHNIMPIFFVKNSNSDLITDYLHEIYGSYNSDMHWASTILGCGQRTSFFEYTDKHNSKNSKIFCYIKVFNDTSPVRIEFSTKLFKKHIETIPSLMDLIYYMLLVQGKKSNLQIRPIAVAEMYARETIKLIDIKAELRKTKLTPTMNEERWGL